MSLPIKTKLLGTVALLVALMLVVGVVGIKGTSRVSAEATTMYDAAAKPLADMGIARAKLNENRAFLNNHILESDAKLTAEIEGKIEANDAEIDKRLAAVKTSLKTD